MSKAKRAVTLGYGYKISVPRAHKNAVERTALLGDIFSSSSRVVVFQAPAGHGKTSLMLQVEGVCSSRGILCGWLSLDGSDNDLRRLLEHLQDMVKFMGSHNIVAWDESDADDEGGVTSVVDWILTEILGLGAEVAIFLDDLHAVSGQATLSFLRNLLACSPSRIRWYLSSRVVPEVGLPRLVVGDEALIIHSSDLRFSRSELARFFSHDCSPPLNEAELDAISLATEGWPAAAQLYRLALRSPSVRHSLRSGQSCHLQELSGYLAENVLSQQDERIQKFLLRTSILERMSAQQCDTLLECSDSNEILEELDQLGLFVRRLESQEGWFSYHALFAQFLRNQFKATAPNMLESMHRRAADWYRQNLYLEGAVHHLVCCGDFGAACEVFDEWSEELILDGYLATVDHWSSKIPLTEFSKHPSLVAKIVWALTFLSRHQKLEPLLPIVRGNLDLPETSIDQAIALCMVAILEDNLLGSLKFVEKLDPYSPTHNRFRTFGLSAVSNARGYAAMAAGNFVQALEYLALGRTLSNRADATFTLAYSQAKMGLTLVAQGHLHEAIVHLRSAISDPRMYLEESVSKVCLVCGLVMALYEANETEEALEHFRQYRDLIAGAGLHDYVVICYRAVARIHDNHGDRDRALEILEEAERCAYAGQWLRAVELINWERVRRELIQGYLGRAQVIADAIPMRSDSIDDAWIQISEEGEDPCIGKIRLAICAGRYAFAVDAIQGPLRIAVSQKRIYRQIKLLVLLAIASQGRGDEKLAQRNLHSALTLAAPGRYIRSFLDEGDAAVQLLKGFLRTQMTAPSSLQDTQIIEFVRKLLRNAGAKEPEANYFVVESTLAAPSASSRAPFAEALTKKEARVLKMIVGYMSNEQIAETLFISKDTVKYHIKNIYGKLGVRSRLEAIRMAIKLGIDDH